MKKRYQFTSVVLGIKSRVSSMLCKSSATEFHLQPQVRNLAQVRENSHTIPPRAECPFEPPASVHTWYIRCSGYGCNWRALSRRIEHYCFRWDFPSCLPELGLQMPNRMWSQGSTREETCCSRCCCLSIVCQSISNSELLKGATRTTDKS